MKKYIILILAFCLCPVGSAKAERIGANQVISNINEQLRVSSVAQVVMKLTREGEVLETKRINLRMELLEGKEVVTGNILEPKEDRGKITIMWKEGKASIRHVRSGHGKERLIVVGLGSAFLGSGVLYVEIRVLEDTKNYQYNWVKDGVTIEAVSQNTRLTVYGKRILHVKQMDGLWVIEKIEYFNRTARRLVKTRENLDFVRYNGWRPKTVVVKKQKSKYITELEFDWVSLDKLD